MNNEGNEVMRERERDGIWKEASWLVITIYKDVVHPIF